MIGGLADLAPAQIPAACALFESVFGHSISPQQWHWKYLEGPRLGYLNLVIRDESGTLLGHFGASVFPGVCRGVSLPMAHLCDVMVAPGARGGLNPSGVYPRLLVEMQRRLMTIYPGAFAYGYPGQRPFKLGERLGFYRRLYVCTEAVVQEPVRRRPRWLGWRVAPNAWDLEFADRIWSRLRASQNRPTVERTGNYLAWRYRDHPRHQYRFWLLRRGFSNVGWFVTRELSDGYQWIVDSLIPAGCELSASCAALFNTMQQSIDASFSLHTWLPLADATPSQVVPVEFLVDAWRVDLPTPFFHPGDTDVF